MTRERLRFCVWAGAALAAGLVFRLGFIHYLSAIAGDSFVYGDIAKNWLQRGIYGFTEGGATPGSVVHRPTLIRLPGYPMFLAGCFRLFGMEHYRAVLYVQAAVDLGSCWLASALAGRIFGRRAELPVLWLAALCPFTAGYVAAALTETLTLAMMALAFYAMGRWQDARCGFNRWLWVVAGALGYSILLRPEQGLLAAAVMPAMLWMALRARRGLGVVRAAWPVAVGAFCVLLPLAPWTARNWRTFHVLEPLAPRNAIDPGELEPLGFQRWYRSWAIEFASTETIYWNYDGSRMELRDLPERAFSAGCALREGPRSEVLYSETAKLFADYNEVTSATPQFEARFDALGKERLRSAPICYYVGLPLARVVDMVLRPRTEFMPVPAEWWKWGAHKAQTAFAAAYAGLNLGYYALAGIGLVAWWRRRWLGYPELAWAMVGSAVLRCLMLMSLDNSEARYTLEFFPVAFLLAGGMFAGPGEPATAKANTGILSSTE